MSTEDDIKALQSTMEKMGLGDKIGPAGKMTYELRDALRDVFEKAGLTKISTDLNNQDAIQSVYMNNPRGLQEALETLESTARGKGAIQEYLQEELASSQKYAAAQKTKSEAIAKGKEDDGVIRLRDEDGNRILVPEEVLEQARKAIGANAAGTITLGDATYTYTVGNGKSGGQER